MDEVDLKLVAAAEGVVDSIVDAGLAERRVYLDERVGREYYNLVTPGAFEKELVAVAVLGYPERVGVWSYTLLAHGRVDETSMEAYFRAFGEAGIGLVAIDPNCFGPDIEGESFVYQLERVVADVGAEARVAFVGFSMGGKVLVEFLQQRAQLLDRVAALVLIDPTLGNRLEVDNIRGLLDERTLLIASEGDQYGPGDIAAVLLRIEKSSYAGIHGQMPNKALGEIVEYLGGRMG